MLNRHPLEQSLHHEILHHDADAANVLIDLILSKSEGPSLTSLDNSGRSFLDLAMSVGLKRIADRLFDLQKNDPGMLWGVDDKKRTLLSIAAKNGYVDIVMSLLALSSEIQPGETGYHHWLYTDDIGNLPLHYAAQNRHLEVVKVLLDVMSVENDSINCINHINLKQDTALHLACDTRLSQLDLEIIALLIKNKADITIPNENGETAFGLLINTPVITQCDLFAKLDKTMQNTFLQHYRRYLIANPSCDVRPYFTLAGMHSLAALAAARLEFDDEITIRNFYHHAIEGEIQIPDAIYEMAPLYAQRVHKAEGLIHSPISSQATANIGAIENYQILNDDLVTFKQLIQDVEAYLADLQARPKYSLSNRALGVLVSVMILSVYIGTEAWFAVMDKKYHAASSRQERDQYRDYDFIPAYIFGFLGGVVLVAASLWSGTAICKKQVRIQQAEWQAMIDTLRATVLDKLQLLESKQQDDKVDYLPVPAQTIRDLENSLVEFQATDETLDEVIAMLQQLDAILIQIKQGITLSNKPLSLFFKPAHLSIEMDSNDSSEIELEELSDETAGLMFARN